MARPLESEIEKYLTDKLKAFGRRRVTVWKFTVPAVRGVPDRIILIKPGQLLFAELKRPGGKPRKLQVKIIKDLRAMGFEVYVVDSYESADQLVEIVRDKLKEDKSNG